MANMEFNEEYLRDIMSANSLSQSNANRLEKVEADVEQLKNDNRTLYEMSASMKTLADNLTDIKTDIKEVKVDQGEMKSEIQDLKNAPVRTKAGWFDSVGKLILTAVGTGLVAFILGQLCPVIFG